MGDDIEETKEYMYLWQKCASAALLYPQLYKYNEKDDIYVNREEGEWFHGKDVRRLRELAKKRK